MKKMKRAFTTPIIERVAKRLGITVRVEPKYGYVAQIITPGGEKRYLRNTNFDINTLGAAEIAKDKAYAAYFMKLMGYPVPEGAEFFTQRWCKIIKSRRDPAAAYRYAKHLGFPVIVKPNSKSQGSGVAKVWNKVEFMRAVRALSRNENVFLVQRIVPGHDYRIVILDGEMISAYERKPLAVLGDGRSTIKKLLIKKQETFIANKRDTVLNISDPRIKTTLRHLGLSLRSIPQKGQRIELLANANLSTGGEAIDVTATVHPSWKKLAAQIAGDMNLRYCGLDVMVQGTLEMSPTSYVILEVNAAAGLDHYARIGRKQMKIVENLYEKVLRAMIK